LKAAGLEVRTEIGGHGVTGLLRGRKPGPLVAYRADMDAVRSAERDPVDFASEEAGIRHICGHDLHVTIGLAIADALAHVRSELRGSVLFIFQPAEENATGAKAMLADGIFEVNKPVAIYGVHTAPYEIGQIGTRPGAMMAARDRVTVTVKGSGDLQSALKSAREAVLAQSTIKRGEAFGNANEDFVMVEPRPAVPVENGMRFSAMITLASAAVRERVRLKLKEDLAKLSNSGVTVVHDYEVKRVAGVTNDAQLTDAAIGTITRVTGHQPVTPRLVPAFSEDFGSFQDRVPGVFFFVGVSNAAKKIVGMPHSPGYVADEDAIAFAARTMAAVLLDRLERQP
jgi:metal-dependent amidase/aminoacylase/carboxypeptidase family protein